jgi:hypothetical protein
MDEPFRIHIHIETAAVQHKGFGHGNAIGILPNKRYGNAVLTLCQLITALAAFGAVHGIMRRCALGVGRQPAGFGGEGLAGRIAEQHDIGTFRGFFQRVAQQLRAQNAGALQTHGQTQHIGFNLNGGYAGSLCHRQGWCGAGCIRRKRRQTGGGLWNR